MCPSHKLIQKSLIGQLETLDLSNATVADHVADFLRDATAAILDAKATGRRIAQSGTVWVVSGRRLVKVKYVVSCYGFRDSGKAALTTRSNSSTVSSPRAREKKTNA